MGKTYKRFPNKWFRKPKGKRNAKRNNVRNKAIPPDSWDDLVVDRQASVPYKAAAKMIEQGMEDEDIIHRLINKFHLKHSEAKAILNWSKKRKVLN